MLSMVQMIFFCFPGMERSILFSLCAPSSYRCTFQQSHFVRKKENVSLVLSIQCLTFIGLNLGVDPTNSLLCGLLLPLIGMQNPSSSFYARSWSCLQELLCRCFSNPTQINLSMKNSSQTMSIVSVQKPNSHLDYIISMFTTYRHFRHGSTFLL